MTYNQLYKRIVKHKKKQFETIVVNSLLSFRISLQSFDGNAVRINVEYYYFRGPLKKIDYFVNIDEDSLEEYAYDNSKVYRKIIEEQNYLWSEIEKNFSSHPDLANLLEE